MLKIPLDSTSSFLGPQQVSALVHHTVSFAIFDVVLAWPRSLLVHLPLLARDIRRLSSAKDLLMPQVRDITALFSAIANAIPSNVEQLHRLTKATEGLADKLEGVTTEKALKFLYQEKEKFQKVSAFFKEISLRLKEDVESEERDIVTELSQTATLLNALIDDLSSREGMFSGGKKRPSAQILQAEAVAISFPEKVPESPEHIDEVAGFDEEDLLGADAKLEPSITKPPKFYVSRPVVATRVSAFIAPALLGSDQKTLDGLHKLTKKLEMNFARHVVEIVNFCLQTLLWGGTRFILYDLPWLIIKLQRSLSSWVDKTPGYGLSLVETKNYLMQLASLVAQLDRLKPIFTALEIYSANSSFADTDSFLKTYKSTVLELTHFVETTDTVQIARIIKEFKGMIFKINPMLIKALDKLHGRSLASVAMPNPFKIKRPSKSAPKPEKGDGDAGASINSSGTPDASESRSSTSSQEVDEKAANGAKKFFSNVGKAFMTLAKVPEGGQSQAASARKPSGSL